MSTVTDMAQAWHDNGDDDAHVIYQVANEIAEATAEKYDLDMTEAQQAKLEMALHDIVNDSIDWDEIADNDENAREYARAKREAIYK